MAFEEQLPSLHLRSFIRTYWRIDGLIPGETYLAAPKRFRDLVINVGAPQFAGPDPARLVELYDSCWLTGFRDLPLYLKLLGPSVFFGVQFRDLGLPAWLASGVPQNLRWTTHLHETSGLSQLIAQVTDCRMLDEASRLFDEYFLDRMPLRQRGEPLAESLRQHEHSVTVSQIVAGAGGGARRLRERVKLRVGVTPRRFARVARFDAALRAIAADPDARIVDVAHSVGYYDEPHMAHDFAMLCGMPPAELKKRRTMTAGALPCALPYHLCRL